MKMVIVVGLALALSAQPTQARLNGRWWVQASQHDRLIYQMAFIDAVGLWAGKLLLTASTAIPTRWMFLWKRA
jgi:hypothetical protein